MKQSTIEHFASKNPTNIPTIYSQIIFIWEDSCISELQEPSVLEGVGCALAGKGRGSGADEIMSSTPFVHGSPQLNNKQSDACLSGKQTITFLTRKSHSKMSTCEIQNKCTLILMQFYL